MKRNVVMQVCIGHASDRSCHTNEAVATAVAAMTSQSTLSGSPEAKTIITDAVRAFNAHSSQRPDGSTTTAALLALEKTTKQTRQTIAPEALLGTWRLCFSAGKNARYQSGQPSGSGFYIPKIAIAQISFSPDETHPERLTIANTLKVGPLHIRFTGPARYPGKKNLLVFDFIQLEIRCFGLKLYQGAFGEKKYREQTFEETAIAKLPFFAFFTVTEDYLAARGRGGGMAIWSKQDNCL